MKNGDWNEIVRKHKIVMWYWRLDKTPAGCEREFNRWAQERKLTPAGRALFRTWYVLENPQAELSEITGEEDPRTVARRAICQIERLKNELEPDEFEARYPDSYYN